MGGTEDFLDGMGGHMVGDKGPMGGDAKISIDNPV